MTNRPTYRCVVCLSPAIKVATWTTQAGHFVRVNCRAHGYVTTLDGQIHGQPERSGTARTGNVTPPPFATGYRWFFRRGGE